MIVAGGVIGSGIFRKPGGMAAEVGSPTTLLGIWLVAGIVTLFGAISNAEIAAAIPETGGQYIFFERMFGRFFAFLYGWSVFAVIQTGSIAAVCFVFAEYAGKLVGLPSDAPALASLGFHIPMIGDIRPFQDLSVKVLAAGVVVFLTVINYVGVRFGGLVQNIVTIAKFAAMAALVGVVIFSDQGAMQNLVVSSQVIKPQGLAWWLAAAAALQGAFWAYDGWNKVTYIAGEVRNPQTNLPRGLLYGMLLVTAAYLILNAAYAYVLPIDEMASSKLVAADVAERCFRGGGRWIAAAVMLSSFGAANAMVLASARVYFAMARRGVFPTGLGKIHPRFETPSAALLVQGVWSVLLLFSGTFDTLTDALIFASWIFYAAGAAGLFVLRRREPNLHRPYHVPGYPWIPLAFILFACVFLVLTLIGDIQHYHSLKRQGEPAMLSTVLGLILTLIGTPVYFLCRSNVTASGDAVS
jgi:basic amino acid/polyamine antiporter, APA family